MPDFAKLTDAELEDLECELRAERTNRAFKPIRESLLRLGVLNVDQVIDAINDTMKLP
jgi:hypothetical protein